MCGYVWRQPSMDSPQRSDRTPTFKRVEPRPSIDQRNSARAPRSTNATEAAQFRHVRLGSDVAVAQMCRQPRRPDHQAMAPRVLDRSGADPDERERRPRQSRAERPAEQDVGDPLRAESEVVEHSGAGNEHQ
jgi:hypothetical protein